MDDKPHGYVYVDGAFSVHIGRLTLPFSAILSSIAFILVVGGLGTGVVGGLITGDWANWMMVPLWVVGWSLLVVLGLVVLLALFAWVAYIVITVEDASNFGKVDSEEKVQ